MAAEATTEVAVQQSGLTPDVAIFLVLMVIIATISLYEYFSSIKWQQVTSASRNNIVFEEKNKTYGAYEIRNNYNRNLLLIILGLILFIGLSYGGRIAYDKFFAKEEAIEEGNLDPVVIDYYDEPEEDDEVIEEDILEEEIIPLEDQTAFLPPVVTNDIVDTPPPTISDIENKNIGKEDVKGNADYSTERIPPPPPPVEKKVEEIETVVDEQAEFPGGRAALVKYLSERIQYPDIARELGLSGKTVLKFVVNTDGTITDVKIAKGMRDCSECDKEAVRVVRNMPKWAPGKKGGKAVRSYFVLPVQFAIE